MKTKWVFYFLFLSLLAHAEVPILDGDNVGNGGDAVVCRDEQNRIRSLELLDYFEAREFRKPPLIPQLGKKALSVIEKVQVALSRLAYLSPGRAKHWQQEAEDFLNHALQTSHELVDIPDSQHLAFPKKCKVEQFAIRIEDPFPEDPPYLVQAELWGKADNDQRAGIILHEIIYMEANNYGQKNSKFARYFNSYLAANNFEGMTAQDFTRFLKRVHFKKIDLEDSGLMINSLIPHF